MTKWKIPFDNTYTHLPPRFFAQVVPQKVAQPQLIAWNDALAEELGIDLEKCDAAVKAAIFSGNDLPKNAEPISLAYSGHQFGSFVPLLGDGRAHLIGELISRQGTRYDIQLKGSGVTPFSRRGDGRSSLGPVIREYIVSEAMHALGVPTTRALAAVATGELVYREQPLPGGVLTRVAESHIRVGTFEFFAAQEDKDALAILLEYAVRRHYPHLTETEDLPLEFFEAVVIRQADLIAQWMSLGFIHGVMNTDNTLICGHTIDYGPCAFMDEFKHDKVFSFIDRQGRYAFGNQPMIGAWNLACLARALWPLFKTPSDETRKNLQDALDTYQPRFELQWLKRMRAKLGIVEAGEDAGDRQIITLWMSYLEHESLDFTVSFRNLSEVVNNAGQVNPIFPQTDALNRFYQQWWQRVSQQSIPLEKIALQMDETNPLFIPRNHQVERAINHAYHGDFKVFHELCKVLKQPYREQPSFNSYAVPPHKDERVQNTFCGT